MFFEGYINFRSNFIEDRRSATDGFIRFSNGYICYNQDSSTTSHLYPFILSVEKSDSPGLKYSSPEYISGEFFSFNRFNNIRPESVIDQLGIGIWYDEASGALHLYRNIFGQVPIFYLHIPGQMFAFSTSLSSMLRMNGLKSQLKVDVNRIAQYATFAADSRESYTNDTFFTDIKSVFPGHLFSVSERSISSHPIFTFSSSKWNHLSTLEEYGEEFQFLFKESVKNAIEDESQSVASHLSGGLDSSFISSTVRNLYPNRGIHTLYCVTNTKYSDEIQYSHSVSDHIHSDHHDVNPSSNVLESLIQYNSIYGHPERMVLGGQFQGSLMEYAKGLGSDILLIGHPGDSIVGDGLEYFDQLFAMKDWSCLHDVLKQNSIDSINSPFYNYKNKSTSDIQQLYITRFMYFKMLNALKKESFHDSLSLFRSLQKNFNFSGSYFLQRAATTLIKRMTDRSPRMQSFLTPSLHSSVWKNTSENFAQTLSPEHLQWADGVFTTQGIGISEQMFALGNYYQIKNKFPFNDKNLFELSLSVPTKIKFDNGRGRGHLREAMRGIVPEIVRNRTDKAGFSIYANDIALEAYRQAGDFLTESSEVWHYIDRKKFMRSVQWLMINKGIHSKVFLLVIRTISLAVWLDIVKRNAFI